ncbi:agarase [Amycolatopsis sp. FDAARGOS 1241]|uniref:agarase n=1 Tax=Amycolatopsis sp. FDAARGOS 1241 TaxID=2778070 RepID=UPI00194F9226|nr:agarase [Amycolatopsis sp. FDAARGOS 1241]QRP49495.1 agarase [Amycolatopsis sp. FDAARGOS 1241]
MAFFRVAKRRQWTFLDPRGEPFPSIGVAHAHDTNLRYGHNLDIWRERYGGDRAKWLRDGLGKDLREWGFTTVGATGEYISGTGLGVTGMVVDLGHAEDLPGVEVAEAGLPYVQALRVAEIEAWNGYPAFRDPRSAAFAEYCDHLARTLCRPDDPLLLGYFLVDGPAWAGHPTGAGWAGPLAEIAEAYYATATAAIRRHDQNHLILGDRYGTKAGAPGEVLDAAAKHVDVLSVQTFPKPGGLAQALETIERWHTRTGLPVLVADTGNWCPTRLSPHRTGSAGDQAERAEGYVHTAETLAALDWCLGWHWCAYVENPQRGWGLKDPWDEPYEALTGPVAETNRRLAGAWAARRA